MANLYEIIEKSSGKRIGPPQGNVAIRNFWDQEGDCWKQVGEVRNAYQDDDYNDVHQILVEERAA